MLVLTAKTGEAIVIPIIHLVIVVVVVARGQVRLGFECPPAVKVWRLCIAVTKCGDWLLEVVRTLRARGQLT